jgi:hypothetical protein
LFGTLSTAGPTDSAYTHSFTISESNQHQSLALFVKDPNTTEAYKLAMVNTLELVASLDDIVKLNVNFISKKGNAWGSLTPSFATEYKFTKKHVKIKVASDVSGLAAATQMPIKSLRLTLNQNTALDDQLGSAEPEDILNHQLSVEGELVLNYENETYKSLFTGGTAQALEIFLENDDETISSGSTKPSLKIQMPKVDFYGWEPGHGLEEVSSQTLSFKASYDVANSQNIVYLCQLVNGKTSY